MKTAIAASDRVFSIINTSSVLSMLDGQIYKGLPLDETIYQKRNISVATLPTTMDFVNEHVININVFAPDLPTGQADEDTLKSIADEVIATLEGYGSESDYCEVNVVGNSLVRDAFNRSYMNIRIELLTE
jgi:hypothetical protein